MLTAAELCVPSPLMKPWPGRNVTPQRSRDELKLVPLELCWLFGPGIADSPSLIPRRLHFLSHLLLWTVLGVRFLVKLEAHSFSFRSFPTVTNRIILMQLMPK